MGAWQLRTQLYVNECAAQPVGAARAECSELARTVSEWRSPLAGHH
jgi:hypothetical protein